MRWTRFGAVILFWVVALVGIAVLFLRVRDHHIVIAAGPSSGESFALAQAIAQVVEERYPDTEVEVFETQGSSENVRLIDAGHADFATVQADVKSEGGVQAVASLYFDAYQLVVRNDSEIRSPADLPGQRVAIGPLNSGQHLSFWFLADHYGVGPDQVVALPMSSAAANFAMIHGQADAVFRVRAVGDRSVRSLMSEHPMRIVPIDQAAALSLKRPSVSSGIIPRGSYRGSPALPERDLPTAVVERFLVARADLDPNVVHSFTRALFEERSSLVAMNPLAGYISAPDIDGKLSLPLHAGARRYYDREKPNFWQQNARILAPTLYVIAILTSTLFAVRARILNRRKVRIGDYNLELMEIAEEAAQTQQPEELQRLKDRLVAMLRQLVQDLDGERVSQDEFEHFSFTWSAVDTLVRDRHTLGTSSGGSKGGGVEE